LNTKIIIILDNNIKRETFTDEYRLVIAIYIANSNFRNFKFYKSIQKTA